MEIREAAPGEVFQAARLAARMWDDGTEKLAAGMEEILRGGNGAVFLAVEDGQAQGFAQVQLRRDYVEGTETSPVGYLEGVYVAEGFRRKGLAGELLRACENWARERGCKEFASDCELDNEDSLAFHLGMGFAEVNRIICFTKRL